MKWFVMGYLDIKKPSQSFKYPILYGLGVRSRKFIKALLKIRHDVGSKIGTVSAQSCIGNGCDEYHGKSPSQFGLFVIHQTNKKFLTKLETAAEKAVERRDALDSIQRKTSDSDFVEYLESLGLEALGEIKAIDRQSETELNEYLDLHNKIYKEDLPMPKETMLNQGIELLQGLDLSNADGVTVNTFTYDDGSTSIEVGVSFPSLVEQVDEILTKDGAIKNGKVVMRPGEKEVKCLEVDGIESRFCFLGQEITFCKDGFKIKSGQPLCDLFADVRNSLMVGAKHRFEATFMDGEKIKGELAFSSFEELSPKKFEVIAEVIG